MLKYYRTSWFAITAITKYSTISTTTTITITTKQAVFGTKMYKKKLLCQFRLICREKYYQSQIDHSILDNTGTQLFSACNRYAFNEMLCNVAALQYNTILLLLEKVSISLIIYFFFSKTLFFLFQNSPSCYYWERYNEIVCIFQVLSKTTFW